MSPLSGTAGFDGIGRLHRAGPSRVVPRNARGRSFRWIAAAWLALGVAVPVSSARAACDPQLFCETRYPAGPNPHALVVSDFNADGIADIAIANLGGSVTLHFGRGSGGVGDGTFAPSVAVPVGGQPFGITAGDFNADGIADLAIANYQLNSVQVLLGQGVPGPADGTFAPPVSYPTGGSGLGPYAITNADFNGDGIPDLAVALNNCSDRSIAIFLGHADNGIADGTFRPATRFPVGCYMAGLQVADLTADGILDLGVGVHYEGQFGILRGLGSGGVGNGSFGSASLFPGVTGMYDTRFVDLNADGIRDAVSAGSAGLAVSLGRGTGGVANGTFNAPSSLLTSDLRCVEVADFDGDGARDIVCAGINNILVVFLGQKTPGGVPNGQFAPAFQRSVGNIPIMMATGDFNEDGRPDLAIANYLGNDLSILLDLGPGHAEPTSPSWNGNGVSLTSAPGDQTDPRAVTDGAGGAIAAWEDRRSGKSAVYAQRVNAHGDVLWSADGIPVGCDTTSHTQARLAPDGSGGAWVAWLQAPAAAPDQAAVVLHHVSASGAADPALPCAGVSVSAPGFAARDLALAPDGAGGVLVAYAGTAEDASAALYCQRIGTSGQPAAGWPAAGVALASGTAGASFSAPDLGPDGAGGAAVAWRTQRASDPSCAPGPCAYSGVGRVSGNGTLLHGDAFRFPEDDAFGAAAGAGAQVVASQPDDSQILARRIGNAGVVEWTTTLCAATGERRLAALAPQGGGAATVWTDRRAGDWDLFASRVTAGGALADGWPTDGLPVCTAPGDQTAPQLIASADGGATLCWVDRRAGDADLYAIQLDAAGAPRAGWNPGGRPLCAAAGDQSAPVLVASGAGGAIAVWQDARSDNGDIYAAHVPDPSIVGVEPATLPGLALAGARPNPARGVVWAAFSLPDAAPASLELFDLAGRRMMARDVGGMGAGPHLASLSPAPLLAGHYVLTLRSGGRALSTRVVVTR